MKERPKKKLSPSVLQVIANSTSRPDAVDSPGADIRCDPAANDGRPSEGEGAELHFYQAASPAAARYDAWRICPTLTLSSSNHEGGSDHPGDQTHLQGQNFTTDPTSLVLDAFAFQEVSFHGAGKLLLASPNFVPGCSECGAAPRCHYVIVLLWESCGGDV